MPRGSRKTVNGEEVEETRRTILRTAESLFMEYGYRAVSTRQIADACGLTQPALYHHFTDKQQLYVQVIKENIATTQSALERIARRNEGVEERLRAVVRYLFNAMQNDIGLMLHDIQYELSDETRDELNALFRMGLIEPIASIFAAGLAQGLLLSADEQGLDAYSAAYLFMNMLSRSQRRHVSAQQHVGDMAHTARHEADIARAEAIVRIMLYGLVRR